MKICVSSLSVPVSVCLVMLVCSRIYAGVVSHYSFDSGYTDSTGNNNGTLVDVGTQGNSAVTTAAGTYMFGGGAMDFSAEKDYISVALTTNSGAYAIAFWGKRRTVTEDWDIAFGRRTDGLNFFGLTITDGQINGGGARFRANSSVSADAQYPFDKPDCTNWHHYAVSVSADNSAIVYIDGVPLKTNTVASSFIYDAIGSGYTSDDHNFNGLMDELWFFDQAVDADTVNLLMNCNRSTGLPSYVHYEFDGDLSDSSGSQGPAAANGNVGFTSNELDVAVGEAAVTLDGASTTYLTLDQQINFADSDPWSICFWARRGESGLQQSMVMGDSSDNNDFIWLNDSWGGFRFRPTGGGSLDFTVTQDLLMHHYALVNEGDDTISLYVDGQLNANKSWTDSRFQINAIGKAYTSGLNFKGVLDDIRIYTNTLCASEVSSIYADNTLMNLVLDLDFENGLTDNSANGNNGTMHGSGIIATNDPMVAVGSKALKLNGDGSSYVSLASKIDFDADDKWTVMFRARRASVSNLGMVAGDSNDAADFIFLDQSFNGLRFRASVNDAGHTADFSSLRDTKIHHYALVADGTGNLDLYRDGSFEESITLDDTSFEINSIGRAYSTSGYDFNGEIDDIKVYANALSPEHIQADCESGSNAALLLHYTGDQDFSDQSIFANDGNGSGNAAVETTPANVCVGEGTLSFDGADNSYVALGSAISFTASDPWTIAFWAQRGEVDGQKGMVAGELTSSDDFIWLNDNADGFRFRSSTSVTCDFSSPKDLLQHHYMLVADGSGGLKLYVDGELSGSLIDKNTSFYLNAIGLAYPTISYHYSFLGQIDDFRVYNDALDVDDAAALYAMKNTESQPPEPTPVITKVLVYLQGGQSNSDGRADPSALPANLQSQQSDVDFYYGGSLTYLYPATSGGTQFGPEITCGRGLADGLHLNESNRVAIIKYAVGGTDLYSDWIAGGDATTSGDGSLYVSFQSAVTAGMVALANKYPDAELSICGMTWMQGESDCSSDSGSAAYYTNMTNFIADVRLTYNSPWMPFIIGRLSSGQTVLNATNLEIVRNAQTQADIYVAYVGMVDTDTFGLKTDNLHFDADGQQSLGYGFASKLLNMHGTVILFH